MVGAPAQPPALVRPEVTGRRRIRRVRAVTAGAALRSAANLLVVPGVAFGLWILALQQTDMGRLGRYGLLPILPPAYFCALVLVLVSFAVRLSQPRGPRVVPLVLHIVVLLLLIHGTVPALLAEPQYGWVYKHIGVADFISAQGRLVPETDIYQQWPAFFAAVAAVSDVSGVPSLVYAEWAPVLFNAVDVLLLAAVCRSLRPHDRRLPYLAAVLFLSASWVGQDYLAPQAFAFTLSLGLYVLILSYLRHGGPAGSNAETRYGRLRSLLHRGEAVPGRGPDVQQTATGAVFLVFAGLVASHQLTPYVVILGVAGLVVVGAVRPKHLVLGIGLIALVYLIPRWTFLAERFDIFSGFDVSANAESNIRGQGSAASRFTAVVVRGLTLSVWLAALGVVVSSYRRPGRVLVPAVLFLAPFALLLGQNYGGEGVFRVYLSSLPWAVVLVSLWFTARSWGRWTSAAVLAIVLVPATLACLQGLYGQLLVNRISTAEVRASQYLYSHARPDSVLVLGSHTFPTRAAANYPDLLPKGSQADGNLLETDELDGRVLDDTALPDVEQIVARYDAKTAYLVLSRSQRAFVDYFGLLPAGSFDVLEATLRRSAGWSVFYENADVVIFEHRRATAP